MKKGFSLLIVVILLLTSVVFAKGFIDLDSTHWAYEPIVEMSEKGILNGYPDGTFLPSKSITRAEFAKILVLTLDLNGPATTNTFSDVKPDFWGYEYINIASNYLSGYKNGNEIKFLPNDAAVREDIAVAVVVAAGLQNAEYDLDTLNRFSDKEEISENLRKYIAIAVENNLMQGNANGTFRPKGKLTRAEVCKLMMNTTEELEKIAIADQNKKCTKTSTIFGHKQEYTYKYKNSEKHKIYRKCDVCNVEFYTGDIEHNFTYADYCGYCDYYRKSSVTMSKSKVNLEIGEKITLKVTLSKDSNAQTDEIIWSSDNLSVATVSDGIVVAVGEGSATIKAETDNQEVATCKITVKEKEEVEEETITYGDTNEDGKVNLEDLMKLSNYVVAENTTLTAQAKKNADVNDDGKINGTDLSVLTSFIYDGNVDELPVHGITAYGDVNLDGRLDSKDITKLEEYIAGSKLGTQAKKNADFNGDGKIDETDISSLEACIKADSTNPYIIPKLSPGTTVEAPKTIYGDVNEDGEVDMQDTIKLLEYLGENSSATLTSQGKRNADLNVDGKINNTDVLILNQYLAGWDIELPAKEFIVYGDANEDGVADERDALRILRNANGMADSEISKQGMKNADINVDGKVNGTDAMVIMALIAGWDIEIPAEGITAYGDANLDGRLDSKDIAKLESYISGSTLGTQAKKNADFNGDGKINETDITSLEAYLESQNTNNYIVPLLEPGKTVEAPKTLYGDTNEDGVIDGRDSIRLAKYVEQNDTTALTAQGKKNADLNLDGKINKTDILMLDRYLADWDIELPTKGYIVYGDVNEDGEIDMQDTTSLLGYLSDSDDTVLTKQGKKNADLNADGMINNTDVLILNQYLAGWDVELPAKEYVANEAA